MQKAQPAMNMEATMPSQQRWKAPLIGCVTLVAPGTAPGAGARCGLRPGTPSALVPAPGPSGDRHRPQPRGRTGSGPLGEAIAADLENAPGPAGRLFGAVVVTNYLWRPLLPTLVQSLAPGGVLLY